jgi:hypothetical protein
MSPSTESTPHTLYVKLKIYKVNFVDFCVYVNFYVTIIIILYLQQTNLSVENELL